jgi:PIN domain nuclease of toxin-antitoxin system
VDVADQRAEVALVVDEEGAVAVLEQVPAAPMTEVAAARVVESSTVTVR